MLLLASIGVHQRVPEPGGAVLPWLQQVLHQEARRDHADAVVHPARAARAAACRRRRWDSPSAPAATRARAADRARRGSARRAAAAARSGISGRCQSRCSENSRHSTSFRKGRARSSFALRRSTAACQTCRGRDLAPVQVRRKAGGALDAGIVPRRRDSPRGGAGGNARAAPAPPPRQAARACRTPPPSPAPAAAAATAARPATRPPAATERRRSRLGTGNASPGAPSFSAALAKGAYMAVRPPVAGGDLRGRAQGRGGEEPERPAGSAQRLLDAPVRLARPGLVHPAREHLRSADRLRQGRHHRLRPPARQQERQAALASSARSAASEWCSHQRDAPPSAQRPADPSSRT